MPWLSCPCCVIVNVTKQKRGTSVSVVSVSPTVAELCFVKIDYLIMTFKIRVKIHYLSNYLLENSLSSEMFLFLLYCILVFLSQMFSCKYLLYFRYVLLYQCMYFLYSECILFYIFFVFQMYFILCTLCISNVISLM